jgi:integrase
VALHKLRPTGVRSISAPGLHGDGGGLYLKVTKAGTRSWVYRFQLNGRRRGMGIGSADVIGLGQAREHAQRCRELVAQGIDPIDARLDDNKVVAKVPTFEEMAADYIRRQESGWSNSKHAKQWTSTLKSYAFPVIGKLPVDQIETWHLLLILEPIWVTKAETAKRVRGRVETILDSAKVLGHRGGQNPASWRGHLALILPSKNKVAPVKHHPALPYEDAPEFFEAVRKRSGFAALGFQFLILTAARTSEVLGATWDEIGEDRWIISAERMKARKPHAVPLSKPAIALLEQARGAAVNDFVFSGNRGQLSNMAFLAILKRMKWTDITPHGFRSTFRDWAAETTAYPSDVVEMALAHTISNKVEAAYRRGDLFEKRRSLMTDWATHLIPPAVTYADK